ncbi:MFS transporter [Edwardsiella tarda]
MERVAVQMTGRWQLAMIIAAILPLLDSSIINVILPDIAQSLPGELATMPWLVTLYLIASVAGVLLSGYLTARWGFRCVWRASLTVFAAASVVLALASRFDVMLLGRAIGRRRRGSDGAGTDVDCGECGGGPGENDDGAHQCARGLYPCGRAVVGGVIEREWELAPRLLAQSSSARGGAVVRLAYGARKRAGGGAF